MELWTAPYSKGIISASLDFTTCQKVEKTEWIGFSFVKLGQ